MRLDWQSQVAVLETDHVIPQLERERILSDLQAMGIRAMILPVGVTLAHVADQGLEPDDEDDG